MGSVFKRGETWWMKFKSPDGDWTAQGTSAQAKSEAKALLVEVERQVERKRLGLDPRTLNPEHWTVGDLLRWWLDEYSYHQASQGRNASAIGVHLLGAALAGKKLEHVAPADIEELLQSKHGDLGPGTINHLRRYLVRAFNKARKRGKWLGVNPAESVEVRRVPETVVTILSPEQVFPFFKVLRVEDRPLMATAILSGLRKGGSAACRSRISTSPGASSRSGAATSGRFPRAPSSAWCGSRRNSCPFSSSPPRPRSATGSSRGRGARCVRRPGSRRRSYSRPSSGRASSTATRTSAGGRAAVTRRSTRTGSCVTAPPTA